MRAFWYPFTHAAAKEIRLIDAPLEDVLSSRAFQPVRRRAVERVRGALHGEIPDADASDGVKQNVELLSYPLARLIVSCIDDDYLLRRYVLAEAKLAHRRLRSSDTEEVLEIARDLGMSPIYEGDNFRIHFTDFVISAARFRSQKWKLINRTIDHGYLKVTREELLRLMQERIRDRIQEGLPLDAGSICEGLSDHLRSIRDELASSKRSSMVDLGEFSRDALPPCMRSLLEQLAAGRNLAHTARFALTSFLLNINLGVEDIIGIFNNTPDFDEEMTRYQIEHIAGSTGTRYTPPSCSTMLTYGNCPGGDELCRRIKHPISYYRRRLRESRS
ncbi:MAG: DNA primase regulatory subunit PriL [Methanothrix sp.]|jgi:DNA primase large subunit|uniref:DNA primase large subunit PriL n=1 Tax=Methanothrix thermoacetophila (strain DSM 6194 / JCM 14653 / NBRC 101360 / PT) TaxID=349307 RepID=A0B7Y9_METTP|nr:MULTISPECIES: DNA primase regulatory subunit PriL [Methanothrix]ABK14813.1 DNA primase large subunit [Methanothrix thermoacetophila PT]MBC7080356.1 DNA primase regulatory subunit PriL [Methanothrix sp.]NPU87013.1 DNA primase regulatory subunit PriL [Methanothrix sp.]